MIKKVTYYLLCHYTNEQRDPIDLNGVFFIFIFIFILLLMGTKARIFVLDLVW